MDCSQNPIKTCLFCLPRLSIEWLFRGLKVARLSKVMRRKWQCFATRSLSQKVDVNNVDAYGTQILTNAKIGVKKILVLETTIIAGLLVLLNLVLIFDLNVSVPEVLTLFTGGSSFFYEVTQYSHFC
jgi:hypothetical protein